MREKSGVTNELVLFLATPFDAAELVRRKLKRLDEYDKAVNIGLFMSMPHEVSQEAPPPGLFLMYILLEMGLTENDLLFLFRLVPLVSSMTRF